MALEQALDGLAHVLQQVPSIGDLPGLGRRLGGGLGVGRRAVPADQLDVGMGPEPRLDGRGITVRQEIDDVAGLEVDDDGAIALPLAPGPVVDADEPRGPRRWRPRPLDAPQQRVGAGRHGGLPRQPRPGFAPQGRADGEVELVEPRGRAGMPGREPVERLHEDATRTFRLRTGESADRHAETDLVPEDRLLGETAGVAAVDPPGLVAAGRARCPGAGGRDPQGQGVAVEVGPDQATAGRGAQELRQEQVGPPGTRGQGITQERR